MERIVNCLGLNWQELEQQVKNCQSCSLSQTRTNVVFGVGNPASKVLFVGEGPGANEDAQGEPFVGRSGQLLDKMLLASGFSRTENIFIANMVKCRPPNNRDPEKNELDACIGYLKQQIELLNPKFLVCLGRVAAQYMIAADFKVTKQHGDFVEKDGILMMGTFHPAALLRNPNQKPDALADFFALREAVKNELGESALLPLPTE